MVLVSYGGAYFPSMCSSVFKGSSTDAMVSVGLVDW